MADPSTRACPVSCLAREERTEWECMGENGMGQAMAGLGVGVQVHQDLGHPARFSDLD